MARASTRRGLGGIAALLGCLVALVAGELLLRVLRPPQLAITRYPCIYEPDPRFGFRYTPGASGRVAAHFEIDNRVEINSLGFYDEEPEADGAAPRVLAVGDSFTAAMNVPKPAVWTSVVEAALRRGGHPRADVVNLGLDGTGTDVHLELLRAFVPRLRPDVVVLAFYANDALDVLHGRFTRECYRGNVLSYQTPAQREVLRRRVDAHRAQGARAWLFERSLLVRLVAAPWLPRTSPYWIEFQQPRLAELGPAAGDRRAGLARLRTALAGLEALAASCDCRLLVAPVPPRRQASGSLEAWRHYATDFALERIDVLTRFERERDARGLEQADLYFARDDHLNALGNEIYGHAVAEALRERL